MTEEIETLHKFAEKGGAITRWLLEKKFLDIDNVSEQDLMDYVKFWIATGHLAWLLIHVPKEHQPIHLRGENTFWHRLFKDFPFKEVCEIYESSE